MSNLDPALLFRPLLHRKGMLLAVSGGKDSTALMVLAARWRENSAPQLPIYVATVDHGLRPEAADEAKQVAANAQALGFDCIVKKARLRDADAGAAGGGNLQARARAARYQCLADAAREAGCDSIATAHHRDDQAETFLLRLTRGSGVYGLGAMRECTWMDGLALVRPLLHVERAALHLVADESGLACVDDPSNQDMAFARIRWRSMMPQLHEAGLTAERIGETSNRLRRAGDALDHYAAELLRDHVSIDAFGAATADTAVLAGAPEETVLRALARLLQSVGGSDYTPRLDRIEQLVAALKTEMAVSDGLRRTLNGCVIDLHMSQMRVYREWGRTGPACCAALAGSSMTWDGRFRLDLPGDLPHDVKIGPLGDDYRELRGAAPMELLRTIPGLFAADTLFAVPQIGNRTALPDIPVFTCRNIVNDRLFNPRSNHASAPGESLC